MTLNPSPAAAPRTGLAKRLRQKKLPAILFVMDTTSEITKRLKELENHPRVSGINAAIRHIKVAEEHYERGMRELNENAFNDVIYRCNQAFEGMLKEAYLIIVGSNKPNIIPFEIETYFANNKVLKSRVMELIRSYRKDWRNASTHDHTINFNEDEALLAMLNVSSFSIILLGDIIDMQVERQGENLASSESIQITSQDSLFTRLSTTILGFSKIISSSKDASDYIRLESKLIGFLKASLPEIDFHTEEKIIVDSDEFRPDIVAKGEGENILIEVKLVNSGPSPDDLDNFEIFEFGEIVEHFGFTGGIKYTQTSPGDRPLATDISLGKLDHKTDLGFVLAFPVPVTEEN